MGFWLTVTFGTLWLFLQANTHIYNTQARKECISRITLDDSTFTVQRPTKKRTEAKSHLTEQESRHFHEILPHRFSYQTLNNTETQIQPVWAYLREDYKTEMVCSYPLGIYIYFRAQSLMGKAKIFLCSNEKSVDFG